MLIITPTITDRVLILVHHSLPSDKQLTINKNLKIPLKIITNKDKQLPPSQLESNLQYTNTKQNIVIQCNHKMIITVSLVVVNIQQ